ncbi:unnamed protein product [Oppiella nova]|uniref:Basigin n=1 Tax=Oppiella nova TaxID=334625 RepID=A0A7R9LZI1_9ACAR|nr:unnamed protein product [Oppiella nova]CAG2168399.1 unnamed protein product [Oppiella nova]
MWFRDDIPYESFTDADKRRITIRTSSDWSIDITKARPSDVGNWRCQSPRNAQAFMIITVRSKAWLYPWDEYKSTNYLSTTLVEGQAFHQKCQVIDGYTRDATVHWYMYNENKVVPSDRYYYVCMAINGISATNNTIFLRVKGKWSALWPFIGIVSEFVILFAIIYITERYKVDKSVLDTHNNSATLPIETDTDNNSVTRPIETAL